ncbi:MAG: M43 family zinc metalloprotease [Bacteroidota bacterium]
MRLFLLSLFAISSVALVFAVTNPPHQDFDYTVVDQPSSSTHFVVVDPPPSSSGYEHQHEHMDGQECTHSHDDDTEHEHDFCGTNWVWQTLISSNPEVLERHNQLEEEYYRDRKNASSQRNGGPPYTIPVVFHIVHQGGPENISDAAIQTSLDFLNQSFANTGPYDPTTGVPTDISFCLAKRTPEGTLSSGIERINNSLTSLDMSQDLQLKNLSRYDPTQYLNIWVVGDICGSIGCGVAGYAYFPAAHGGNLDGIVVEARWLGNTPGGSSVLTHEVGHYLGLYHTFEGGCLNDDCLANGDRVCDTPPDQSTAAVPCNAMPNSCTTDTDSGFSTDQPDMFQNYMDYGDWDCYSMFTDGQRERMHFFLEGIRASLMESQGCLDPCLADITVEITTDFGDFVAQGESISLTATGNNVANYTWFVDGVEIGIGNPFNYTFPAEGSYNITVEATNSDPNCLASAEAVAAVRCPVQSSFSASSTNVGVGSVVYFTNVSTDATTFEWQVDGTPVGTDMSFFYQFDVIGTYAVTLVAGNGNCTDNFSMVITVGLTGTSQTGLPIWPMQGGSNGGFHTLDWRTIPPLSGAVGPISDQSGGATGVAFNDCGGTVFYVAHTSQPNQMNQLFIYSPDGTPLLTNSTPNAPGLNAVRASTENQVIPVPGSQDEWYIIYRNFGSDVGAPLNNAGYLPLELVYSRVRLEVDGSITVLERNQFITAGGTAYDYSDGIAVSRTVNGDPNRHYLYAARRSFGQNSLSLDRWIIDDSGISWEANTGTVAAQHWELTHAGSPVELSPTEDRIVVGNRNQWSNYVDYIIFSTDNFTAASATSIVTDNLVLVADGQPEDDSGVLPVNQSISALAGNASYPLRFVRNFPHKISRMEFSPNGRFLYLVGGGFQSGSSQLTTTSYIAQVDLETNPLQVRLQMEAPPANFNPTTGLGCPISQCGADWQSISDIESSFDGNLYVTKRNSNALFVIPNPNSFMPQRLVPGVIDLSTAEEPNINLPGRPGTLPDQIDGFNYLSSLSQTVTLSIFGLDCAGNCRAPFDIQVLSDDGSFEETFTITDCPTEISICADTTLAYRLVDPELGVEYPNAIVNGQVNAPDGGTRFEFSEPQGCPEDCDEPYVYFYGEGQDYGGRTLLSHDGFLFVGGYKGQEALLAKMTTAGDVVWVQTMQPYPSLPNVIADLKIDSEGLLIGVGSGQEGLNIESFAFKMDPDNGALVWTQTYSDAGSIYFQASDIFEATAGGDYTILGTIQNQNGQVTGCDGVFYTIDRNNGQITTSRIHFHLGSCESFNSTVVRNGNFYVTGRFNFAGGGVNRMRAAIMSINSSGTAVWSRLYLVNPTVDARMYSEDISLDGPNNLVMLAHGDDNGTDVNTPDIWLTRTNLAGGAQWSIKYTFPEAVSSQEVLVVENGYVIVANARNNNTMYVTRVNGAGDVIWAKQLNDLENIRSGEEIILLDGFLYMTASHFGNGNTELALMRMDLETGELTGDCVPTEDVAVDQLFITAPYDGFNAITPYNSQVQAAGPFDFVPDNLEPLPISCGPPCGPEDCENGIDDDGDGLADCEDPDCDCFEEEICDNDIDDDGDGLVDCEDPDLAEDCCCYEPPTLDLGPDVISCENGVVVLDAGPDFESYQWSDLTTEQTLTTLFPGLYSVTVTDRCGNEQVDEITIIVDETESIDLGPDVELCPGETLTFSLDGFATYEWFPEDGFDCNDCPTVTYTATENDTIIVVGTTDAGCISTDTLLVTIGGEQQGSFTTADLCTGDTLTFGDITITEAGLYIDTVAIGECVAIDSLEVTLLPTFNTSEDVDLCQGDTLILFGSLEVVDAGSYSMDFTAENGCDSTHTVNVGLLDPVETTEDLSICAGETADIFGNAETEAGEYSMTFTGGNGCDSTHTIILSVLDTFATSETVQICTGSSIEIFGQTVDMAGDYSMTFQAENGCDSTHTVTVEILDLIETSEDLDICAGESADIFGNPETEAGEYSMTFQAENGCDSTHTITLSVLDTFATSEMLSICAGESVDIFGNPETEAGDYSMTFQAENGCDSTHTITLTVLDTFATSESVGLCPGGTVTVFGDEVDATGDYSMTFPAENGCDSTHTITVFELETFATNEMLGLCPGGTVIVFGDEVDETGIYSQSFTAENGCDSTHTINVFELETFMTSETLPDQCAGSSVDIFGDQVTESGIYSQTFTAENGCDSTHTITVTFLPPNETEEEIFLCEGESVEVLGEMEDEAGMYSATFTGANGCDSTHTITLTLEEFSGSANIFPPCPSDPDAWIVYIRTVGNGGPYTVTWNGNVAIDNTINGVPPGEHVAEVTSANGCIYMVEFRVRPYNLPWRPLVGAPTCNDPQSGVINILVEPTDEDITFSLDGENFSDATLLEDLSQGEYILYVQYGDRCIITDTVSIPGPDDFSLVLPDDQTIEWRESITITPTTDAGPGATYKWWPASGLDCDNCDKVTASPTETTRYFLQVTDADGCSQIDDILIAVDPRIPYYVPNAFSPNGDGQNDFFTAYGDDRIQEIERMIIFDRWGGQVFTRENFPPNREQLGWNGKTQKQEVQPGVFVYYFEIRMMTGELVTVKGDVLVLK